MIAEIRHHEIIEQAARGIGELGVALAARCNRQNVLRHQLLQRQRGILDLAGFRSQGNLAHVRDVEQAGVRTGVQMFPEHAARVLHRHVIARERHHLAAALQMQRVERRFQKSCFGVVRKHRGPSWSTGTIP